MIWKQSKLRVNLISHRVDSLICTPQNTIAIMALDYSRLGLQNKAGRIFCVRQVYFTKSTSLGTCKPTFYTFIHHMWGETVPWGTVFIIQTSDRMRYFTIFQYKLHSFSIQDDRSTRGLLAKPLKKFPKLPMRQAGYHFCKAPKSTV